MLNNFKELKVQQKSNRSCLAIYKATRTFPKRERLKELKSNIGEIERMMKALINYL